ncbi:MAG: OsmC family protein [Acetobacteraceae bacterium]|nr:OsmC family protein [Acetobacteraceae bacterium]
MAIIRRTASAAWQGTGKEGKGSLTTQSGTLRDTPYGFSTRFGDAQGTNPEELIAAAHAGCFTMALAFRLSGAGHTPESLRTEARLSMEQEQGGWRIAAIALTLRGKVPGCTPDEFRRLAEEAKATCPVSRVLNAEITLDAAME